MSKQPPPARTTGPWFKHILFRKISMYNIYCDNINTLGYERKQNAYIVLPLALPLSKLVGLEEVKIQHHLAKTSLNYTTIFSKRHHKQLIGVPELRYTTVLLHVHRTLFITKFDKTAKFVITAIRSAQKSSDRVFFLSTVPCYSSGKHTSWIFVRIASPRQFSQIHKTYKL